MPTIRNKLNQRISINLKSGINIDLLSRGTADISEDDLKSSQLQNLIAKDKVIISSKGEEPKKKRKSELREKKEPEVSGTGDTSEIVVNEPIEKYEEQPQEPSEDVSLEPSEDVSLEPSEDVPAEPSEDVPKELHEKQGLKKVHKKKSK